MKYFKTILFLTVSLIMLNGCASSKPKQEWEGAAFGGKDIPLSNHYNIADFKETTDSRIFSDIHFGYNDYTITANDRQTLENIAGWLKDNPRKELLIEGHCDNRGSNAYNISLGEKRALSVRRYLSNLGANAGNIYTISYGEEKPLAFGEDEHSLAQNRRAHFLISK